MSNTAYSKSRSAHDDFYEEAPAIDEEYEEYEEYDDYEDEAEPTGLFSSPARTVALVASLVVLLVVAGSVAWLLGQKLHPQAPSATVPINQGASSQPSESAPKVGAFAPDFTLTDVKTNKPLQLSALKGKPVVVNFWGTWCPPCRAEMPELEKIYQRVKGQVEFVGVSMGPRDEPAGVAQFVKLNNYNWTFVHDTDASVSINYRVEGIPSTFFIDKNGVIRDVHVGGADAPTLESGLQAAQQSQ